MANTNIAKSQSLHSQIANRYETFNKTPSFQQSQDEAEDLAVLLNSEQKNDEFNESLFTIIDEMEEEDLKSDKK